MAGCLFVNLMCMALPLLCLSGVSCQDCGPLDFDIANLKRGAHWWFTQPSCIGDTNPAAIRSVGNGTAVGSQCLILFAICKPVDKLCSSDSGICESTTNQNFSQFSWPQDLGTVTDAEFTKQGANSFTYEYSSIVGHLKGCTKPLKTSITFQCHENKTTAKDWIDEAAEKITSPPYGRRAAQPVSFSFVSNTDKCELNIVFNSSSSEICRFSPNSGGGSSPATELSAGSIILILFLPAVALYFITGVLINSSQGRSGKELIPHHKFWTDLPGLIRDGCAFTIAKVTCCNMSTTRENYDRM